MPIISKQIEETLNKNLNLLMEKGLKEAYEQGVLFQWFNNNFKNQDNIQLIIDGTSKYVLMMEDVPQYVIKFPRPNNMFNYCDIEVKNYNKAVNAGLEDYFACIFLFKALNGISFYLQERVDCDSDQFESDFYFYQEQNHIAEKNSMNKDDFLDFIWEEIMDMSAEDHLNAIFGKGYETEALIKFCYDNKINDLHEGNYGYKNDFPVIIDYCGYFG